MHSVLLVWCARWQVLLPGLSSKHSTALVILTLAAVWQLLPYKVLGSSLLHLAKLVPLTKYTNLIHKPGVIKP